MTTPGTMSARNPQVPCRAAGSIRPTPRHTKGTAKISPPVAYHDATATIAEAKLSLTADSMSGSGPTFPEAATRNEGACGTSESACS